MSSQNEENEQGTMVNTQTLVTQTLVTQTQKRKPRGVTSMKSVVRARSNNNKLTIEWNAKGQPCNNKGGNKLVSYIGVLVRQNISIKFKYWSDERLNAMTDIIWNVIITTFNVDEQHIDYLMKSVGKALQEFRTNCGKCLRDVEGNVNLKPPAKYANFIDEVDWLEFVTYRTQDKIFLLEQSETPSPSSATVDLDVLWVDARKNKQGVIDNEKVQVTLKERESFWTAFSQVILEKELGLRQYPGRICGAGFGASKQFLAPSGKRATKADVVVLLDQYDLLAERFLEMERKMETGKFVEGPEASTTVKESFKH
ncbi:hypothetical protein Lal_00038497 [Lupinus albus]|nr:hypothetical protein Lal_00038497 [Lupinus albus]